MIRRVGIVPRWAGRPDSDWYPWLSATLGEWNVEAGAIALPDPHAPEIGAWVAGISAAVGDAPEQTLLVGHSVGCQAVLRYAATLAPGRRLGGAVLVAGWWWVNVDWVALRPWLNEPYDVEAARQAVGRVTVVLSDNDPYTPETEANVEAWRTRLGAEVVLVPGARHFNEDEEPAVLEAVLARLEP